MLVDSRQDIAFGGNHHANVVSQKRPQFVLDRQVLRITGSHRQGITVKMYRDNSIHLRHRFGNLIQHVWRQLHIRQLNGLHPQLLSQSLGQLIIRNQAHVFSDPTQQRARPLLLLFEHDLELFIGDEA